MNQIINNEFPLQETQNLRYDLLSTLTDEDLAYKLPGNNLTLGELCVEMGEIEHIYIQSFKTLKMDWDYSEEGVGLSTSVAALQNWYKILDEEFEDTMQGFTNEDLANKKIDRGDNFKVPLDMQFAVYREAILMFYAKASVYMKALEKSVNDQWQGWIG